MTVPSVFFSFCTFSQEIFPQIVILIILVFSVMLLGCGNDEAMNHYEQSKPTDALFTDRQPVFSKPLDLQKN